MKKVFVLFLVLVLILGVTGCKPSGTAFNYDAVVQENPYFIHALGGDGSYFYLNSLDVMEKKYAEGFRLFEGDASMTSDGRLVMTHRWNKKNITEYLGLSFDEENPVPSFDEFMSWEFHDTYQATSFVQVLDFMREHPDVVLMLDSGIKDGAQAKEFYEAVLREAEGKYDVLDRVMLSAFNEQVLEAGLEVYDFSLRNFYIDSEKNRSEEHKTIEQIIAYCKEMNCQSCSVSTAVVTEEICQAMKNAGLYLYVFTTNDKNEADQLLNFGATSVGTDFLE